MSSVQVFRSSLGLALHAADDVDEDDDVMYGKRAG